MDLPDQDIVFELDPQLKEHWLDGWGRTSKSGRVARGFMVAGVAGGAFFVVLALMTTDFEAVSRELAEPTGTGVALAHLVLLAVGAVGCLLVALLFFLGVRRYESVASTYTSGERLVIDREGYLVFSCRDERDLVSTGNGDYYWGRGSGPGNVRASVAYLPGCTFRMVEEYRELAIEPACPGAVRTRRFATEEDLASSGVLRTHLHAGRTPEQFLGMPRDDEDIAVTLFPVFSPDVVETLRALGVAERG